MSLPLSLHFPDLMDALSRALILLKAAAFPEKRLNGISCQDFNWKKTN